MSFLPSFGDMEGYINTDSPSQRTGKESRRLSRRGPIAFEIAETPERYDILIAALMRQKTQRDLDARGYDSLDRPGFELI